MAGLCPDPMGREHSPQVTQESLDNLQVVS